MSQNPYLSPEERDSPRPPRKTRWGLWLLAVVLLILLLLPAVRFRF